MRTEFVTALLLLLAFGVASTYAYEISPAAEAEVSAIVHADEMLGAGLYDAALSILEPLALTRPTDAEVRWRLGKTFIDLGESTDDEDLQRAYFGRAVVELREAVRLDPDSRSSVFNLAIAVGREGLAHGARAKVRASREVKELAERTIEIDPSFDGAYHLLGRWHREVKSLGFFTRALVKVVYGGFPDASYEAALGYFEQAHALRPRMAHLLEIGICQEAMGNRDQAREIYQQVLDMPDDHADSSMIRAEAKRRLDS